jgi:RNA polymerase sigma-54 factor
MDMNFSQLQKQEQKLILTNEMKLSLKLLQMPVIDLQEYIMNELNENPILEIDYDAAVDITPAKEQEADITYVDAGVDIDDINYDTLIQKINSNGDDNLGQLFYVSGDEEDINNPFNYISRELSLKDYLKEQLINMDNKKDTRYICEYLIDCIDEDGFITEDIREISEKIKQPYEMVNYALKIIQDLQPWGIGASDFKECLIIQLKKRNILDKNIYEIIINYLELLADNKLRELAKILGITVETVQKYVSLIKTLEPKPARGFYTGEVTGYIIPEAFIKKLGKEYYILMNDNMLPRLNVNSYYCNIIKEENNAEAVYFIKDKVSSAVSLIKGIEQRRNTIYRIIEKIIEYQKEYFDKGEAYLKPMSLKMLSENLNLHESTISRAVKDKYISTPTGTVRIKELFTNGLKQNENNEEISTNLIRIEIEKIIQAEDKHKPLSDRDISELISKANHTISRRTIAKYREELGIKSSSKRRIYF